MAPDNSKFNQDELEPPAWLNVEFITNVLKHCEKNEQIKVMNMKTTPATMKGDHYASVMFRVATEYRLNDKVCSKSMIIKTMPELEGDKKEMLKESHIFETEIGMYTEVIPKFEQILRAAGDDTVFGPTCLYHSLSPRQLMIFEDLVPLGYTVMRERQVNLEEAQNIYTKIAKWHAVSYKLNLEQPNYFDEYRYGIFSMQNFKDSGLVKDGIVNFLEMLATHDDLVKYKPYFEQLEKTLFDDCYNTFSEYRENPQSDAYYVLSHGDFHYKNMMFKHNKSTQKIENILFHDFQLCYVGPIVNDILYSIYMVLNAEQRMHHLAELLHLYFTTFQQTLEKLNFNGPKPKLLEFRKQMMKHKNFELFLMVTFLPMWYSMETGDDDPDKLMTSESARKDLYKNQTFIDDIRQLLPKYLHQGYLEN